MKNGKGRPKTTTLAEIKAGKFPSAVDKHGTDGVQVIVNNVVVHEIKPQADGDWHLVTSSPDTPKPFIMEIIPRDQAKVGKPPLNVPLRVRGIPFDDKNHAKAEWHGFSGWELHPVLSFAPMSKPVPSVSGATQ